jgi:hypothetical protein
MATTSGSFAMASHQSLLLLLKETNHNVSFSQVQVLQTAQDTLSTAMPSGTADSLSTSERQSPLHALVLVQCHNNATSCSESRVYWLCLGLSSITAAASAAAAASHMNAHNLVAAIWLDRFATPETVAVQGLCAVAQGTRAYAVLRASRTAPLTGLALDLPSQTSAEAAATLDNSATTMVDSVDFSCHEVQSILPGSMVPDTVTHGGTVLDSSGYGLCIRSEPTTRPIESDSRLTNRAKILALVQHLSSVFFQFYADQSAPVQLPPSLATNATRPDMEAAVVRWAHQLTHAVDPSAAATSTVLSSTTLGPLSHNPMDTHLALIQMLRQGGVYRDMSLTTKWQLLTLGQHINVYRALRHHAATMATSWTPNSWERQTFAKLTLDRLSTWLANVQTECLETTRRTESGPDKYQVWISWLALALGVAVSFREEQAWALYDVMPNTLPLVSTPDSVPSWTSTPEIRDILVRQLEYWLSNSTAGVSLADVEDVLQKALLSNSDSFRSCPCPATRTTFVRSLQTSFGILRAAKGRRGDALLFELAMVHHYYQGICQISWDHQSRLDSAAFALPPLFLTLADDQDIETGMTFGLYVLQWHLDREYYGCVLDYGKYCVEDLNYFLAHSKGLAPYRWIHLVRQAEFDTAAESLLQCAMATDVSLSDADLAVCQASLVHAIVEQESTSLPEVAAKRRRAVDKKRELIYAQMQLLNDNSFDAKDILVWEPKRLLNHAIRKSEDARDVSDKVYALELALSICSTSDNDDDCRANAMLVWLKAILADRSLWEHWLTTLSDLTEPSFLKNVLEETVFGRLYQRCEQAGEWENVSFRRIQDAEFVKLGELDSLLVHKGFQRVLRSVAKLPREEFDAMVVSNYG